MRAGRKNGLREGRQEGRRETLVELIVALFDVRGIPLTDAEITRLQACTDLPTLERWAELAREAESGAALLDGPVSD